MLNREKVRLMTSIAMYSRRHERIFQINKYFGYDYIVWNLLLAAVRYTFGAFVVFGIMILFDAEIIFYNVNLSGISAALKELAGWYFAGLVIYMVLSFVVYGRRYKRAQKDILYYNSLLKRLARRFHYKRTGE